MPRALGDGDREGVEDREYGNQKRHGAEPEQDVAEEANVSLDGTEEVRAGLLAGYGLRFTRQNAVDALRQDGL